MGYKKLNSRIRPTPVCLRRAGIFIRPYLTRTLKNQDQRTADYQNRAQTGVPGELFTQKSGR